MRYLSIFLCLGLISCGEGDREKTLQGAAPTASDAKKENAPAVNEGEAKTGSTQAPDPAEETKQIPSENGGTAETNPNPVPEPSPLPNQTPNEESASFAVDPATLSFPVVFHLGGSAAWKSEESLRVIVTEVQRILAQAKVEILPQYSQDAKATEFMDVSYVPSVPDNPTVNGISFGGAALEVFVRDKVGLGRVQDGRPETSPTVRIVKDAKPGEAVKVGLTEAMQARTTAHEICHQLGLPHRQDSTNLMASGTTGWTLNEQEIATVRKTATGKFKAKFVAEFKP